MALIGASNSLGGLTGSNAIARLLVVISGESSGLTAAVAQSEGTLQGLSKNASSIGKTLTRSLTLPLLALGGLAIKTASDFETSFARVVGISTVLDKRFNDLGLTTDTLRASLIAMSNDPAITATPKELADALYFAGSAGLKASQALDVVKLSAEGASVGMGDITDISKVLIFALSNFSDMGLTAASAMDTLAAAIQEGTASPDELAIALGRLLPISRQVGISFQETVASVAALSNIGVPTRVATTSLRALFSELLAPTQAATERLQELGLTSQSLADALKHGGVIEAFRLIQKSVQGDQEALHDILPQIRGFTAFLGLTQNQMKRYRSVLDGVTNSTGKFGEILSLIQQTPEFKFDVALKQLKNFALVLGEQLMPVFLQLIQVISDMGQILTNLPGPLRAALAGFIVLGAAAGPVLQLYGALTAVSETTIALGAHATMLAPTWKAVGTAFITAGIAALVAVGGFESLIHGSTSLISVMSTLIGSFVAVRIAIQGLKLISALSGATNVLTQAFAGLSSGGITVIATAIAALVTGIGYFIGASHQGAREAAAFEQALADGAKSGQSFADTLGGITVDPGAKANLEALAKQLQVLNKPTPVALDKIIKSGGSAEVTINNLADAMTAAGDTQDVLAQRVLDGIKAFQGFRAAGESVKQALEDAGLSTADYGNTIDQYLAGDNLARADQNIQDLANAVKNSIGAFEGAIAANKDYQNAQLASILATGANAKATQDLANKLGVSTDFLSQKLNDAGVSAVGLQGKALDTFKTVEFGSADASAAAAEMAQAIATSSADISKSLTDAFAPFQEIPKTKAPDFSKMLTQIKQMGDIAAQESQNIISLQKRAVPTSLIEAAIGAGPGFVAHLAASTDADLKKFVTIYERNLGLVDDAVLAENAHQETKGANMVEGFTIAMLSKTKLPQDAATNIVMRVTDAFAAGNLSKAGLHMVETFAVGMAHVKGLTQKQAIAATNSFVNQLLSGNVLTKSGKLMGERVAQGIHQATGLSIKQARDLVSSVTGELDKNQEKAKEHGSALSLKVIEGMKSGKKGVDVQLGAQSAGKELGHQFAVGITQSTDEVDTAAQNLAKSAKQALVDALHNSPELFTYYLGKKLISDLGRGMKDQSRHMQTAFRPKIEPQVSTRHLRSVGPKVQLDAGGFVGRSLPGGAGIAVKQKTKLYISRTRVSKEIAHESDYSGH